MRLNAEFAFAFLVLAGCPSTGARIAATDTTYGHYALIDTGYDIRLPNAVGNEAFSGSIHPETDFVLLSRSWKKDGLTVQLNIAYARTR